MVPEGNSAPRRPPSFTPAPFSPEELALVEFAQAREGLVFGAASVAEEYLRVTRRLEAMRRDSHHPYRAAAEALHSEIRQAAEARIRDILSRQGAPPEDQSVALESFLGVATLRQWPDVATAVLLQGLEDGDRLAPLWAGNIDQNSDFLALHLRSLLLRPDLRSSVLDLLVLLFLQAAGPDRDRLADSPAQRHLAAAFATGEVREDDVDEALRRLASRGRLDEAAVPRALDRLRYAARAYADLARNAAQEDGMLPSLARRLDPKERELQAFLRAADEESTRSYARALLHDEEGMRHCCHRLAEIAYIEAGIGIEARHRAEERLALLGHMNAERLVSEPERTLAEWLNPHNLLGTERDMILTIVAVEDLRSGGAAARILRGALQNPLFRHEALGLMAEVVFRNPPGYMEEQLLEALANEELGQGEERMARLRDAADDVLGPTLAALFMAHITERLKSYTPGAPLLPFSLPSHEERWVVPFLASTAAGRVQRSIDLVKRRIGWPVQAGLREGALQLIEETSAEEIVARYRAVINPEPLQAILRKHDEGQKETVRQLICDLVVLHEVIQRMDRDQRKRYTDYIPIFLVLRVLTFEPELCAAIQPGDRSSDRAFMGRVIEVIRLKYAALKRNDVYGTGLWSSASPKIRRWAEEFMLRLAVLPRSPLPELLRDDQHEVRLAAAQIIQRDPRYIKELLGMLESDDPRSRLGALLGLAGTGDAGIRRKIAAHLEDEGEIGEAAASALGGLEETLLSDLDVRVAKAAAQRLYASDPASVNVTQLLSGFRRVSGRTAFSELAASRYQWTALIFSRNTSFKARKLAYAAAADDRTPLDATARSMVFRHLALRFYSEFYLRAGAEVALRRLEMDTDPRLLQVMARLDYFRSAPKTAMGPDRVYLVPEEPAFTILRLAAGDTSGNPARPSGEIMQLYRKSWQIEPSVGYIERGVLVAGAYITRTPLKEVMELHGQVGWLSATPRAVLAVVAAALPSETEQLREIARRAIEPEGG